MSRIGGVVAGTVQSLDDPNATGRIQVSFDWMDGAPTSNWARVAAPMAGGKRGAFFQPEVNDEVLVAFDQGDTSNPYIVGYCWSGADKPPYDGAQKQRGITTVLGHQLTFGDDPSASKITLSTPGGYELLLDESGTKITLQTQAGISLTLDDAQQQISLSTPTGNSVTIGPAGVSVTAAAGALDVTAMTAAITASAVTIDAAATTITGVLTVTGPVIANGGIVSATYTPGVGNLL